MWLERALISLSNHIIWVWFSWGLLHKFCVTRIAIKPAVTKRARWLKIKKLKLVVLLECRSVLFNTWSKHDCHGSLQSETTYATIKLIFNEIFSLQLNITVQNVFFTAFQTSLNSQSRLRINQIKNTPLDIEMNATSNRIKINNFSNLTGVQ